MSRPTRLWVGFSRWRPVLMDMLILVIYGPLIMPRVLSTPRWWELILFVIWLVLFAYLLLAVRATWRNRHKSIDRGLFGPSTISLDDLDGAVIRDITARHRERVPAVKELRETYPGLCLKDATILVDRHRAT